MRLVSSSLIAGQERRAGPGGSMQPAFRIFLALALCAGLLRAAPVVGSIIEVDADLDSPAFTRSAPNLDVCFNSADNQYLVVHVEGEALATETGISATRIDAVTGSVLGTTVIAGVSGGYGATPSVAYSPAGGGAYLIAYTYNSGVNIRSMSAAGDSLSAPVQAEIGGGGNNPDVAFDGTRFLVVWNLTTNAGSFWGDIRGRRFDPAGAAVDGAPFTIDDNSVTKAYATDPVVSWLGAPSSQYLVAYAEGPDAGGSPRSDFTNRVIRSRTVASGGGPGGAEQTISTSAGHHDWPRIAANIVNQRWMVVWEETDLVFSWAGYDFIGSPRQPVSIGNVAYREVATTGIPTGAGATAFQADPVEIDVAPDVAYNANDGEYVIHWQRGYFDTLNRTSYGSVLGSRIEASTGALLEPVPTVIQAAQDPTSPPYPHNPFQPMLAHRSGTSELLCAWGACGFDIATSYGRVKYQAVRFLSPGVPPPDPTVLAQYLSDGATPLPLGDDTRGPSFVAKATVSHPAGGTIALEVEVAIAGAGYLGSVTTIGAPVPSGTTASTTVTTPIVVGSSYHWRARAVRGTSASGWVSYETNPEPGGVDFVAAPNATPTATTPLQLHPSSGQVLPPGAQIDSESVTFSATIDDTDGDPVAIEVELLATGQGFDGTTTTTSGFTTDPTASLTLPVGPGSWHWRLRAVDPFGGEGSWVSYGGNPEPGDVDFVIVGGSTNNMKSCLGSAGPSTAGALLLLIALAAAFNRN